MGGVTIYRLGLVSVSFRSSSPEAVLKAAKEAGLSCIEWGSDIHAPCTDEKRLREIASLQREEGLTCCSYGTYFRLGQDNPAELTEYINAARILGTDILRLWCGTKGSDKYPPEELEALYDDCRAAAKLAQESGVTLCMECHNDTLTDRKESALALMEAVNSPSFRMYYQPNQLRTTEENTAYARLMAPYTEHVHVFNWDCPNGGPLEKYPLADGVSQWTRFLEALPGERTLLLEFMPDDRLESLKTEADALRKIAGESR